VARPRSFATVRSDYDWPDSAPIWEGGALSFTASLNPGKLERSFDYDKAAITRFMWRFIAVLFASPFVLASVILPFAPSEPAGGPSGVSAAIGLFGLLMVAGLIGYAFLFAQIARQRFLILDVYEHALVVYNSRALGLEAVRIPSEAVIVPWSSVASVTERHKRRVLFPPGTHYECRVLLRDGSVLRVTDATEDAELFASTVRQRARHR
jgi:hypothetical protein